MPMRYRAVKLRTWTKLLCSTSAISPYTARLGISRTRSRFTKIPSEWRLCFGKSSFSERHVSLCLYMYLWSSPPANWFFCMLACLEYDYLFRGRILLYQKRRNGGSRCQISSCGSCRGARSSQTAGNGCTSLTYGGHILQMHT